MPRRYTQERSEYRWPTALPVAASTPGSGAAGDLAPELATHPNRLELGLFGLPPTPRSAARLRALAIGAVRRALGELPAQVAAAPAMCGRWRVCIIFRDPRPALKAHELSDVQVAWARRCRRAFGRPADTGSSALHVAACRDDARCALAELREAQAALAAAPTPAGRVWLQAALNRLQVAHDALRRALERADPVRLDRPLWHDALSFRVALAGHEALWEAARHRAVRRLLARAAALPDPSELSVCTHAAGQPGLFLARMLFNFRNAPERREQHLSPASLGEVILDGAVSVPPLELRVGATLARVSITAIDLERPSAGLSHGSSAE